MIDLNSGFDNKQRTPFNMGKAGIVDVTISSVEKDVEGGKWVVTFADANGGTLRDFYDYLDVNHPNYEGRLKAQGISLKHLWDEAVGKVALPKFNTPVEMLDTIMTTIAQRSVKVPFRVVVDYGQGDHHNQYLNRKRYVPFLERNTGQDTALFLANNAHTVPNRPTDLKDTLQEVSEGEVKLPSDVKNSWLDD